MLEKAQEELRTRKAGARTTSATTATAAATPIRAGLGSGRSRQELAAIRTWARANDHQVADAGMVRKAVLEAYGAAHQAPVRTAGCPMAADDAIVLVGFLDETVPGRRTRQHGAVPPHHLPHRRPYGRDDPALQRRDPKLAHALINDLQPGDQLRVTGHLRLPRTPDEPMWLDVTTLAVLETAPQLSDPAAVATAVIERHGPYLYYFDAEDASEVPVWTVAGTWLGTAGAPGALGELIKAFEQRQAADGE
ncbi:histone-like nucleoid-structuring protein Lsr2 [Streptomyces sp. NPDC050147]|uniref:Lsr2 family DNA-binding protein n=1 Tax=Streptomyces sp. NPDC050147 TaxID=3155513 RepID=UPI0034169E0E